MYAATGSGLLKLVAAEDGFAGEQVLGGLRVQCVATAAGDPSAVYCGCHGDGLYRSRDGGTTFERLSLPEQDVFSVAVSRADGAIYAGCEPSRLYRSRDGGGTWEELKALHEIPSAPTWSFPPRPWTSHVRWVAPSPDDADVLLVGIELGGVMRSDDGGASFHDHPENAVRDAHALAWHPSEPGRAYEAGGRGAAWSSDWGRSWRPADEGRDLHYVWGLAVDPEDPERWFVSASRGPSEAHGSGAAGARIYRFEHGTWRPLGGGLPEPLDSMPYALHIADGRLYAGLRDGRLYASEDLGDSWRAEPISGARPARIVALA